MSAYEGIVVGVAVDEPQTSTTAQKRTVDSSETSTQPSRYQKRDTYGTIDTVKKQFGYYDIFALVSSVDPPRQTRKGFCFEIFCGFFLNFFSCFILKNVLCFYCF